MFIGTMKRVFLGCALVFSLSASQAQDFVATESAEPQLVAEETVPTPTIDGIVTQIFTGKPWQAVNPAAPAEYGNGEKNVTKDIAGGTPHQASTLTIAGIEW